MNGELDDLLLLRCETELDKNNEYMALQRKLTEARKSKDLDLYCELTIDMQSVVIEVVYRLAAKDTCNILLT